MDSDEDGDNDRSISLTHLLFGNIDDDGNLENDFLDPESIRHLHQLPLLGIGTQLKEITDDVDSPNLDFKSSKENGYSDEDCDNKSPSAVDYSDITELAEDSESTKADEKDPIGISSENKEENVNILNHISEENDLKPSDTDLMPPPPLPPIKDEGDSNNNVDAKKQDPVTVPSRPLANMLPSKYKNMDVTKLFPEFRHGQVLRFSRLFGPGKQSSLPQIWKGVKKKKKKRSPDDVSSNLAILEQKSPSPPLPEECESDEETKLLKPEEKSRSGTRGNESFKSNELSPGLAAWRYGPAKLWYEMLGVPESGEGFDYGFKEKEDSTEIVETVKETPRDDEFPDDAYFMVTMLPWEEDVIWNGEEVKHKVLSKLNSRNNAAGWVPSSLNRTASAFKGNFILQFEFSF